MQSIAYRNSLLRSLDAASIARLRLQPIVFETGHPIEIPGRRIERLFFVEQGMASMTTTFLDGSQVEVGTFGYEGIIGVSALMGTKRSLNRVYTQIPGTGYSCLLESARAEFALGGHFQSLALRYVQAQLMQTMQSVGCNMKHRIDQKLARWLLLCADRANSHTFELSQEYIADMIGSTRSTVSVAAGLLKADGLIEYVRGAIHLLDVERLEQRSCECYHIIKDHLNNYTQYDSGILAEEGVARV